ncbi:J domain-containing protein [Paraburkholderia lycopersici]|uniref:DnaJ domain-containing protein n=1 Tax=Paraburkholderia lycopersici TaxID=416944 RepID=A0A1G6SLF6_9BURK|nr:J domain-containing protein [Paraburkholderia lycopersici]SDD17037.1 DnaJ domain-containing protein [Paraburkholderia lycopersici]
MATLYDLLGVRDDASDEEIKRAYRRAAMKAHPDRNMGREASAHAQFQEIKEAYAILSDAAQRRVYDAVYAEEMGRLAREQEEAARVREAARQEAYARHVSVAMRFAGQGYNRDVVFGVLLGSDCELQLAGRIADGAVELHLSRQTRKSHTRRPGDSASNDAGQADAVVPPSAPESTRNGEPPPSGERPHSSFFSAIWHGMFGLHP